VDQTISENLESYMQSSSDTHRALKLATTYKMALMYLLVIIHINNQFTQGEGCSVKNV
jgi:hypothetical protein